MRKTLEFALKPIAALVAIVPLAGLAQDAMLGQIVISAPKINMQPTNSSGIDEASLASKRAATSDTASLLNDLPGVSLYGAGGISSLPVIHGLADDRLRIKVDGMDLISACPNHMNSPLSYIDPSNVGNVKVFAGIAPVSMGGDSIGGTVSVASMPPEFAVEGQGMLRKGQAGIFYRSNGNAKGANVSATIASDKLNLTYSGSTTESGDYKAARAFKPAAASGTGWLDGDVVGSSRYKSENQELSLALRQDNHLLELKLGKQFAPYEGFPNQRMDMTRNDSNQANLRYTGQFDWGSLEARLYEEKTRHAMNFGDDKQYWYGTPATIPGMPMDTQGKNTGALVKADVVLSARDVLRVGAEIQHYRLNDWWSPSGGSMAPNTFWNVSGGQRDRTDMFGEWETRWNPQWLSQFGIRSDTIKMNTGTVQGYFNANKMGTGMMTNYLSDSTAFNAGNRSRTDNNLDFTALARYMPSTTHSLEFGFGQKTRSPSLYERYLWSTGGMAMVMNSSVGDGNGYVGNPDLKPEVAHTLSATADWHDAANQEWGLKATPYLTYVHDYIDARRCLTGASCTVANTTATTGFVYLQFVNQSARLYGMDVSGHFPLAKTDGYGSFTATGLLNYVRGENRTTGDNLYNIMPLNAKLAVVQSLGNWTNTAELQLVAAKTHLSQVRDEIATSGYSLVNLRSSYEWKQVRLDIGIENLFNRFHTPPLGGAYVGQGTTMSAAGASAPPWGVPVPGMARSIYAGLNLKF